MTLNKLASGTFRFDVTNNTDSDFYNTVLALEFAELDRTGDETAESTLVDIRPIVDDNGKPVPPTIPILLDGSVNFPIKKGVLTTSSDNLRVPEMYLGLIKSGQTMSGMSDIKFDPRLDAGEQTTTTLEESKQKSEQTPQQYTNYDVFWARPKSTGVSEFPEKPGFPGIDPLGPARPDSDSNVSVFYNLPSKSTKIHYRTSTGSKVLSMFDSDSRELSFDTATLATAFIPENPTDPRYAGDPLLDAILEVDALTLIDEFTVDNSYTFSGGTVRVVKNGTLYFFADLPYLNVHNHDLSNHYENWGELVNPQFPQGLAGSLILADLD